MSHSDFYSMLLLESLSSSLLPSVALHAVGFAERSPFAFLALEPVHLLAVWPYRWRIRKGSFEPELVAHRAPLTSMFFGFAISTGSYRCRANSNSIREVS